MSGDRVNLIDEVDRNAFETKALSAEETSQLILASSLSALKPLLGLINFLIKERIVNAENFRAFLEPMLIEDQFPPAAKAMLGPIWKSFLVEIGKSQAMSSRRESRDNE